MMESLPNRIDAPLLNDDNRRHKTSNETTAESQTCSALEEKIKTQQSLIEHLEKCHREQQLQISSLTKNASTKGHHVKIHASQTTIEHVTPSAADLLATCTTAPSYQCQQSNCIQTFRNAGNLYLHLLKHHKVAPPPPTQRKSRQHFHCPFVECKYFGDANQFFLDRKSLCQHYRKVHATKTAICSQCSSGFATERLLANHRRRQCGQTFQCQMCPCKYGSREALQTHCRRKGHKMESLQPPPSPPPLQTVQIKPSACVGKKLVKIFPKPTTPATANERMKLSQQTICTQTIDSNITSAAAAGTKCFLDKWHKRTVATATTHCVTAATSTQQDQFNTNLDFYDSESNQLNLMISSSSQTDRNLNNINFMNGGGGDVCADSINYFADGDHNFPGLCDIETQTEMFFVDSEQALEPPPQPIRVHRSTGCGRGDDDDDDDNNSVTEQLDQLLYNNMQTQTCEDILSDFGWTDIQTQTNWTNDATEYAKNELLVSTETQTSFSTFLLQQQNTYTQTTTGWPASDDLEF